MSRNKRFLIAGFCLALFLAANVPVSAGHEPCIMVVPSRYTVVQFGFDIARIRPVTLVAFDSESDPKNPIIHVWDKSLEDWILVDLETYRTGDIKGADAKRIILVGGDTDLPSSIIDASLWAPRERIPTLSIMTLMNTLKKDMKFSVDEWKWIAQRHRLKIKDLNAERRRYGKYGKRGDAKVDGTIRVSNDEPLLPNADAPMLAPEPVQPGNDVPDPLPRELLETLYEGDIAPEDK